MIKCGICGYEYPEGVGACPACGSLRGATQKKVTLPMERPPVADLMRYVDFMDDESLLFAAVCRRKGIGMAQEREQAKSLFHALALRGNLDGMYQYGEMCLSEDETSETALFWLKTAAEKGHLASRLYLTELAAKGKIAVQGGLSFSEPFRVTEGSGESPSGDGAFCARVRRSLPFIAEVFSKQGRTNSLGAGFLLGGGIVITNAHVVGKKPTVVAARFEPSVDPTTYELIPRGIFPEYDVAVLSFAGEAKEKFASRPGLFLRTEAAAYGEEVYTVGNPLGLGLSVSKGIVSCPDRAADYAAAKEVIQTDITVNHGNSGGALLDTENRVLGMVTYVPSASDGGIAMCIPSRYIVEALNRVN